MLNALRSAGLIFACFLSMALIVSAWNGPGLEHGILSDVYRPRTHTAISHRNQGIVLTRRTSSTVLPSARTACQSWGRQSVAHRLAAACGFADQSHSTRVFTSIVGGFPLTGRFWAQKRLILNVPGTSGPCCDSGLSR